MTDVELAERKPRKNSDSSEDSIADIKKAFRDQDGEASKLAHIKILSSKETHKKGGNYIKSVVYGGLDGIITTFAVVASVAGAQLSVGVVLIMGFANLIADGISMGMGDFLSSRAEMEYTKMERKRESWECDNYLEGEKLEMVELYMQKGIPKEDATQLVEILSRNKEHFVDVMMVEELGLMPPDPSDSPAKNGIVTFVSFLIFGCVPLLAYIVTIASAGTENTAEADTTFLIACILTGVTLFGLGAYTSRFTVQEWWKAGLFIFGNGALAAASAYLIGYILSFLSA